MQTIRRITQRSSQLFFYHSKTSSFPKHPKRVSLQSFPIQTVLENNYQESLNQFYLRNIQKYISESNKEECFKHISDAKLIISDTFFIHLHILEIIANLFFHKNKDITQISEIISKHSLEKPVADYILLICNMIIQSNFSNIHLKLKMNDIKHFLGVLIILLDKTNMKTGDT